MKFPKPTPPPKFYWRLPLVWKQRYCRFVVNPWWNVHNFCNNKLTVKYLAKDLPERISFKWFCFKEDVRDGLDEGKGFASSVIFAIKNNCIY